MQDNFFIIEGFRLEDANALHFIYICKLLVFFSLECVNDNIETTQQVNIPSHSIAY